MSNRDEQLRARVRQLILMRETGPKRSAWHAARMRLIWRLHDEIRQEQQARTDTTNRLDSDQESSPGA